MRTDLLRNPRDTIVVANVMRTFALLAAMTALFILVGLVVGGRAGMMFALVFAVGANLFAWYRSDTLALSAVNAHPVDASSAPDLVADVATLAARAGLPMPRVYVVASPQPNAFAAGRDPAHAAIAVNEGLLRLLSREERFGVLAHEIAHIRNRDTLLMTLTATLAGAVSTLSQWSLFTGGRRNGPLGWAGALLLSILAPLGASIVQMAISRAREYEADRLGAALCGNPLWLAAALERLHSAAEHSPDPVVERHPAMAPMFIVRPLAAGLRDNLFSTHPDIANRIAALVEMARVAGLAPSNTLATNAPGERRARWRPFGEGARKDVSPSFLQGRGIFVEPAGRGPWG